MEQLARYSVEIPLGEIHLPHADRHEQLTERVTVCPRCHSLRTLRHEGELVHCLECRWHASTIDTTMLA